MARKKLINDVKKATEELINKASPNKKEIFILGGSSSEIQGEKIGSNTNVDLGEALLKEILKITKKHKLYLAVQGCEHTNRALVIERDCLNKYNLEEVNIIPHRNAGGAFATAAYKDFSEPVMIDKIKGDLGLDIGDSFISMHLKRVV
ncbi:MAG: TIGR01440 family protein, partial [Candidatus Woesearchaeota archaeon]